MSHARSHRPDGPDVPPVGLTAVGDLPGRDHQGSTAVSAVGPRMSVSILSPSPIIRLGLRELLAQFSHRVSVADHTVLHGLATTDVLVVDTAALELQGDQNATRLVRRHSARVLGVATRGRPDLAARMRSLGVVGSVALDVRGVQLLGALEDVHRRRVTATVLPEPPVLHPGLPSAGVRLTERETQVLRRITAGLPNQVIADDLYLSINSVKSHIRSCYRKVGVATRSQAVAWAVRNGF